LIKYYTLGNFFKFVKLILKSICFVLSALIISWVFAYFFEKNGSWWLAIQTNLTNKFFYILARPFLSDDTAIAEDELYFMIFWIPSFIIVLSAQFCIVKLFRNKLKGGWKNK